jgi:hypothetical protein
MNMVWHKAPVIVLWGGGTSVSMKAANDFIEITLSRYYYSILLLFLILIKSYDF